MPLRPAKKIMIGSAAHVGVVSTERGDTLRSRAVFINGLEFNIRAQVERDATSNRVISLTLTSMDGSSSVKLAQALRSIADELQKQVNASSAVFETFNIDL
jgi:hypothetical protein